MNRVPKKERLERLSRMIESSLGLGCLTMNVLHSCLVGWPRFAFIRLRFAGCFATSRIYRTNRRRQAAELSFGVSGFRGAAPKSSLFFVPAAGAGGGRCFEKIRTSCVYVWHRWRLEQTGNVFRPHEVEFSPWWNTVARPANKCCVRRRTKPHNYICA